MAINGNLTDIYNQTKTNKPIDTKAMARSPFGELELTKHLYENGLKNVFDDYQSNMNMLNQQEQQSLQDAYYMKEMSKKYLGQYASNTGVQDVSGNLLDIYSNYNQNVAGIKGNADLNEISLTREYQNTRQNMYNNILQTQYQIDVAKLQDGERDIIYNVAMKNTGDLTADEYLDQEFNNGNIGKETYYALKESIKLENQQQALNDATQLTRIDTPTKADGTANDKYIGDDYDFQTNLGENVDRTSLAYEDVMGNRYFQVKDPVDMDTKYTKSSEELFEEWQDGYSSGKYQSQIPNNEDIIYSTATDENGVTRSTPYVYLGDTWYRMASEPKFDDEMKLWYIPEDGSQEDTNKDKREINKDLGNVSLSNEYKSRLGFGKWFDKNSPNSITINNQKYTVNKSKTLDTNSEIGKEVMDKFKQTHGVDGGIRDKSFILHKNKVYAYQGGKYYETNKKK